MSVVDPYIRGGGCYAGPPAGMLDGARRTEAKIDEDITVVIEDTFDVKRSYPKDQKDDWTLVHNSKWTGPTAFRKRQVGTQGPTGSGDHKVADDDATPIQDTTPTKPRSMASIRAERKDAPMSDHLTQPCLQESEEWDGMYERIQRERSQFEEIAFFERQVTRRLTYAREVGRPNFDVEEKSGAWWP